MSKNLFFSVCLSLLSLSSSFAQGIYDSWFPLGTTFNSINSSTTIATIPSGWTYVGTDNSGNQIAMPTNEAKVSCNCTAGSGGCSPVEGSGPKGKLSGCFFSSPCTSCSSGGKVMDGDITFASGGFINFSEGISFATNADIGKPSVFAEMFNNADVITGLQSFITNQCGGNSFGNYQSNNGVVSPEAGYSLACINVYGRLLIVPIKNEVLGRPYSAGAETSGSCSCTEGTCTLGSMSVPLVGSIKYCAASSCTGTCTLNTTAYFDGGESQIAIDSYLY